MANTPQSQKRARQTERRTAVNKARRSRIRTFVRKVEEAIASGNAEAAKAWLAASLPADGMTRHFIGVTAAPDKAAAFGCGRTFAFRDWVGGRYSLWSAVSLSCGIALGWDVFERMLAGAAAIRNAQG